MTTRRLLLPGVAASVLLLLGGAWVFIAPFVVGYQPVGQPWVNATRNDLWTGAAVLATAAIGLVLVGAFALRDLARASTPATPAARPPRPLTGHDGTER
jgi:hypothetical protein